MGFAYVGFVGTVGRLADANSSTVHGNAAGMSLGSVGVAGTVLVVAIGKDNTSTASGDNNEVTAVTIRDSANTIDRFSLTKLKERTNAGAAAAATNVSLWWGVLPAGVQTTDFVRATFAAAAAAKVMVTAVFSVGAGTTVSADPTTNASETDAGTLPSLALTPTNTGGSASNGRLVIRASSVENNVAAWTGATSGWTNFGSGASTTSTGGAAANNSCFAEYKIGAGNNATDVYTSAPTGSQAGVDSASVIGALYEAAAVASTGLIKAYVGGSFVEKPMKVWNGSAWVAKPVKVWNGSAWVLA